MALQTNPHVKKLSVTLEIVGPNGTVQRVAHVETDLHLDGLHPLYDSAAVDILSQDAVEYMKSAPNSVDRVSVSGK
jgi:hypothetical protein